MTTTDWLLVLSLLGASFGYVLHRIEVTAKAIKEDSREVFAAKADLARVEERVAAIDTKLDRVIDILTRSK